ncbi:hypothetical protein M569_12723, partial [Genlisea aurea]
DKEKHEQELNLAVRVIHMACSLCENLRNQLICANSEMVELKDDNSLVTVADLSVQAAVSWMLRKFLGQNTSLIAEEDIQVLSKPESSLLLEKVVKAVNCCLADSTRFGLLSPEKELDASQVIDLISGCDSMGGPVGQHWILDPVDGTLGFVHGGQYAVALSVIDDGEAVLGVLGCPNYPVKEDGLRNICSRKKSLTSTASDEVGCVLYASRGSGKAWMQPLLHSDENFEWPNAAKLVQVSSIEDPALATFCEPVQRTHSNQSFVAGVVNSVGVRKQPLRIYSMVKYAAIARGEAEVYMRFARSGYKEKIWDHAAGVVVVQEAGGIVTDAGGRPLDFSKGIYVEGVDRGIVACSGRTLHSKIIGAVDASWESSHL